MATGPKINSGYESGDNITNSYDGRQNRYIDRTNKEQYVTDSELEVKLSNIGINQNGAAKLQGIDITASTPVDNQTLIYDAIKEKYVLGYVSGGSGSANIQIYDEGSQIESTLSAFNFVGNDIMAVKQGDKVYIYSPAPTYPSHYNSQDGLGDATINEPNTNNRNVANGLTDFSIGDWVAGTEHKCLNNNSVTIGENLSVLFEDLNSDFEVKVYDSNDNIIASNIATNISGNIDNELNDIRIRITDWQTVDTKYKAKIYTDVHLNNLFPDSGRFKIKTNHIQDINYSFITSDIFYDSEPATATLSLVSIAENSSITKRLSGIYYYNTGSKFDIGIGDIDNINATSYPDNFIYVKTDEYGISNKYLSSSDLIAWNTNWNVNNCYYEEVRTIDEQQRNISHTGKIQARTIDWVNNIYYDSNEKNILIDTYNSSSNSIEENFDDENNRRTASFAIWNQHILNTNELMIINGTLRRQYGDWTNYYPNNIANYSNNTSEQFYYRGMKHSGTSHSNGTFQIGNINESELNNNYIKIEISLNGIAWFNCNQDYAGGELNDGDGCRIQSDTEQMPTLKFTLGTGKYTDDTTGPDGYGIYIRISMPNGSTSQCSYIKLIDWI